MDTALASAFLRLVGIMDELREKCPWDRKQTIDTLRSMTIEETYELADAILQHDWKGIKEELGDLLLHLVFYAKIGKEESQFTLEEVINGICEKLIRRHPHIYGDVKVKDDEEVKKNWEQLKLKEGKNSVLDGVPVSLPSVVKATRLQEKAKQVGFEWEQREQVWEKVNEEARELQECVTANDPARMEEELGDLMFSIVNYARFLHLDAEAALEKTNQKFRYRFMKMEELATSRGLVFSQLKLQEMDALWNEVKQKNQSS
jgi:XTP/dITP diphosphohydrolase